MPLFLLTQLCTLGTTPNQAPSGLSVPLDPVLLPAGIILITGAFMLIGGRRMLRCGLAILGALGGCLLGNSVASLVQWPFSPLLFSVVGGLVGLGLGLLLWRLTVATVMGASCAAVASLAMFFAIQQGFIAPTIPTQEPTQTTANPLASLTIQPTSSETPPPPSIEQRLGEAAVSAVQADAAQRYESLKSGINAWLSGLNTRLGGVFERAQGGWTALDRPLRTAVGGIGLLGGLFGFLFGLMAWRWSGGVVTALAGAGLVLLGAILSVEVLSPVTGASLWDLHPGLWLAGWTILGSAGAVISWHIERRHADIDQSEPA